jgi:hypothetical protein
MAFNPDKGTAAALKRVMASVREDGCNSLQIQAVERRSFLGMPYVSVSAHPRHIQKGNLFSPESLCSGKELSPVELRAQKTVA